MKVQLIICPVELDYFSREDEIYIPNIRATTVENYNEILTYSY